ncbi:MAG: single-stranded-DNA-specific exonuclease RecJ [Chloroflexi bacterium]|nr:single-stranded-DNA-specific exonuclease RecJ [Chloroflexota bacterium]MDA1146413.1 single-stranded-DNA-specific exonuclease RecJ [Chloroflexota bacterium]MQC82284.1 single-stranded-DNA-specific exonuclease RecJ [Chloroflexota bacterium]MQC82657.1 single-stranded-DNA-specific exonuclease RecJ [Chloroflexota bacterium]
MTVPPPQETPLVEQAPWEGAIKRRPPTNGDDGPAPFTGTVTHGSAGRLWRLMPDPDLSGFADAGAGLPPLMRRLLARRGVHNAEEARRYLGSPGELTDPRLMPNLDVAVLRLAAACRAGETVAVFGDFDVDGVTSTTILTEGLRELGAKPMPYIPDRFLEGYGPNVNAVRQLADRGATLLVTADCGTSSTVEVAEANGLGMEVIVIDHHTVPDELPAALALVNPKLTDSRYGSEPAAVGVAYKVIHDLYDHFGRAYDADSHRALVALGTVCDLAPMVAENRDLVRLGLEAIRTTTRPGLRALAKVSNVDLSTANVDTFGWVLGPRLNAAGRMLHAQVALDLMLADNDSDAERLAKQLDELNRARRDDTQAAITDVHDRLSAADLEAALIVAASPEISSGIIGLAASRLVEQHHRPAIVMQTDDREARGSCRSLPAFDITALLRRHADLFLRFGGHRAAAGFTLDVARVPELKQRLIEDATSAIDPQDLLPAFEVEEELSLQVVDRRLIQWLGLLGPHGIGNPTPVFLAHNVSVVKSRGVGQGGEHLQLVLKEGAVTWRAISFRNAAAAVPEGESADLIYTFRRDDFRGDGALQLEVLDLRPAIGA